MITLCCRPLATVVAMLVLPTAAMAADAPPQVPPPGTSAQEIQRQITGRGLQSQLRSRINSAGLTPDEIRQRLSQLGYDPATLDPYLHERDDDPPDPSESILAAVRSIGVIETPSMAAPGTPVKPSLPEAIAVEKEEGLQVFGLKVFSRSTTQFQPLTNGPVPGDYIVGPGDELVLILTGDVETAYTLPVTREGFIVIPQVGQVWVNGMTLQSLREQMYIHLGSAYSGIRRGPEATTHFQLTLGQLRTNQIFLTGDVRHPGTYLVNPVASVLNALYHGGGPTAHGSFRDIRIVRGDQVVHRVDLYEYLLKGNNLNDVRLEPGDVVFVPVNHPHISIEGEVPRTAIYELLPGGTLADLIQYAGGLNAPAHLRRARITRILPPAERTAGVDRTTLDVDLVEVIRDPASAPVLRPGDQVRIFPVRTEVRNTVQLEGSVWHPGTFEYQRGMRAWELIAMGEGLKPDAYLDRAQIVRMNPADSTLRIIPLSLVVAEGTPADNPELHEYDALHVFSQERFRRQKTIEVRGAVRNPGNLRSFQNMTLRDAILRGGGLDEEAFIEQAYISRLRPDSTRRIIPIRLAVDSLNMPQNSEPLQEHDIVEIYGAGRFVDQLPVTITGAVRAPGSELFQEGMTLHDLLIRAGGLAPQADMVVEVSRLTDADQQLEGIISEVIRVGVDSTYLITDQGRRYYPGGRGAGAGLDLDSAPGHDNGDNGHPAPVTMLGSDVTRGFELRPFDHIHVRRLPDFSLPQTVAITGEVLYPGHYTLQRRDERLSDLVGRAGGLTPPGYAGGSRLYREGELVNIDFEAVLNKPSHQDNIAMVPGDSLVVPAYNPVVLVKGAVHTPSAVLYREGAGLDYYVANAGGYTREADPGRVHVRFANGEGKIASPVLFFTRAPEPKPGSVITVPARDPADRTDWASLLADLAQVAGTVTTLALLISRL